MNIDAVRIMAAFALHASSAGGVYVRLPEIQAALDISEGVYGLVLLGMPLGVLIGSLTVPQRIERFGPRRLIAFGVVVATAVQMLLALAGSAVLLAATLFAYGFVFAGANVSVNVEANRFDAATGSQIMSRCHGWWAVGFLATSLAAAGLLRLGVSPFAQFAGHAVLMGLLTAWLVLPMRESIRLGSAERARRFAWPGRGVILIGGWALAGILMEGVVRGWLVIYVRDSFGAPETLAALALPAVLLTQTAGRFLADGLIARSGIVAIARWSSAILGLGTIAIVVAPGVPLALAGCLLIGFGIAITMPQAFAAAARQPDRSSAESVAAFATLATLVSFMGPPLFGGLAASIGLRAAFALVLPLTLVAFAMSSVLQPARDRPA